jgi:acetyl esterase
MELDPELLPLLDHIPPLDASDPEAARNRSIVLATTTRPPESYAAVTQEDRVIPTSEAGIELPIRIYRPQAPSERSPCLIFLHGGGWISGTIEGQDWRCTQLAAELGAVVVSVGYRLAPEDPFPAAPEDCYAALVWAAASAEDLDIDPGCIGLVGASAGGGLAAGMTLMTRDRGGPAVAFQCLLYPGLDDTLETPSNRDYPDSPVWGSDHSVWAWRYYLDGIPRDEVSPYAAPSREPDLSGLPPAYVMTSEVDPVRDEGLRYALRLLEAGVSCEIHNWAYTFHAFDFVGQSTEIGRRAIEDQLQWLRRAIARARAASPPKL